MLPADSLVRYQVRFNVLQARAYGSPQNRRRVIIWGARRGVPLPEFPIPTHHVEKTQWSVLLDTGLKLEPVTRDPESPHGGAPLRAVTVDDAISDLVSFSAICRELDLTRDGSLNLTGTYLALLRAVRSSAMAGKTRIRLSRRRRRIERRSRDERRSASLLSKLRLTTWQMIQTRIRARATKTACRTQVRRVRVIRRAHVKVSPRMPMWSSTTQHGILRSSSRGYATSPLNPAQTGGRCPDS